MKTPFNESSILEHDDKAKRVLIKSILSQGRADYVGKHASPNGPDLICYLRHCPFCFIELDVKRIWQGSEFPYQSVDISIEKKRLIVDYMPTWFYILNKEYSWAVVAEGKVVVSSPVRTFETKTGNKEKVFQVPLNSTRKVKLKPL